MTCSAGGCRAQFRSRNRIWDEGDTKRLIAAGWRIYRYKGIGDPSLKTGEVLCPRHAGGLPQEGGEL